MAGVGLKASQTVDSQVIFALTLSEETKFAVLAQPTALFPRSVASQGPLKSAFLVVDIMLYAEIENFMEPCLRRPRSFFLHH